MPSPIGHALGGIAAGWLLQPAEPAASAARRRAATLAFATLGMAADLDLLVGAHRGPSHSVGAVLVVGLLAWMALHRRRASGRLAVAAAAAYGSHIALDWLGSDTSAPFGVPALWPVSSNYYQSPWPFFLAVSRHIYQPELFWRPNMLALGRELLVLLPAVAIVAYARRTRRDGRALIATAAILAASATLLQAGTPALAAGSRQQSNEYVETVGLYLGGAFDDAVDGVAEMSEADIREQAGELEKEPRSMEAAAMLHTEAAFRPAIALNESKATFHLSRARELVHDLRKAQSPGPFQRGWYLFLSAQLQAAQAFDATDKCLSEARGLFPRDPEVLVATGAAFELRTLVSSALPQPRKPSAGVETKPADQPADIRRALESAARYLTEATVVAPQHDEARLRLGRVLHRLGQLDRAAGELDAVRRRTPDAALKYLAATFEASLENDRGRPARAAELYLEALRSVNGQAAIIGLSQSYYDQGRGEDAARTLEGAFRQSPEPDPWFGYLLGDGWHTESRLTAMRSLVTR